MRSAAASLFPSLRASSPRTDEAETGWVIPSLADCPGLTSILIRGETGKSRKTVPDGNPGFQARHHSRCNVVKSFPSHLGNTPFAANEGSERCIQNVGKGVQAYRGGHV